MSEIEQFAQQVKDKLGLERFEVVLDSRGNIVLDNIEVARDARKQGTGAAALKELTDYADRTGALIWLSVADRDSSTGTTSRARLVKFYRQFGFIPNKGRNKRFELSLYAHMYRDPKGLQEEINMIRRRAGLAPLFEDHSAASPITHFERGEQECGADPKRCLTSSPGEAGNGVYAMIPNARMRAHYTKDGEALVGIDMKPGRFVVDLTQSWKLKHLIEFAKEEIERTAKQMGGYYQKPKINQSTVQRFGRIIEDYMRQFHPDASGWIVHHKGPGIPTGKQVVLPDPNAYDVEVIRPMRESMVEDQQLAEEIETIRRRAGLPMINENVERAQLRGKTVDLIREPNKQDLDQLAQMVVQKLDGRRPPDGAHVKGFYNPTTQIVWIWDGTTSTHGEVGEYLINKYGWPETKDWIRASGEPDVEIRDEEEGGYIPMILDVVDPTSMKYEWWVPYKPVFNEPAMKVLGGSMA